MADETILQYRHLGGRYQFDLYADDEFTAAETWMMAIILSKVNPAGGIHQWPAPEGTIFPYVAFRFVTALPDEYNFGANAPAVTPLQYNVWLVDQSENYETIAPLASLLKLNLKGTQLTVTGGTIYRARRILALKDEQVFL